MRVAPLKFAALALVLTSLPAVAQAAGGDITVVPTRVVFKDGGAREATISLVNSGDEPALYRMSFLHYAQSKSDGMVEVTRATDRPDIRFADKMLRVSPKNVNLPPNVAQSVRIQYRMPPNLPRGEYRTHLAFTGSPSSAKPRTVAANAQRRPVKVALATAFRLAIPVLVWKGDLRADVVLRDLAFSRNDRKGDEEGTVNFTIFRSGERSTFGTLQISFLPYRELGAKEIGKLTDIAVYHPNEQRAMSVPVVFPKELRGKKGRLVLTWYDPYATPMIQHEASVEVP